jgi:hypothetical protein
MRRRSLTGLKTTSRQAFPGVKWSSERGDLHSIRRERVRIMSSLDESPWARSMHLKDKERVSVRKRKMRTQSQSAAPISDIAPFLSISKRFKTVLYRISPALWMTTSHSHFHVSLPFLLKIPHWPPTTAFLQPRYTNLKSKNRQYVISRKQVRFSRLIQLHPVWSEQLGHKFTGSTESSHDDS